MKKYGTQPMCSAVVSTCTNGVTKSKHSLRDKNDTRTLLSFLYYIIPWKYKLQQFQ